MVPYDSAQELVVSSVAVADARVARNGSGLAIAESDLEIAALLKEYMAV